MAGNVLTEQYVDIVTRNLRETMDALRAIQKQADATGDSFKRMKGQSSGGGSGMGGAVSPKAASPGGVGAMIGAAAGPIGIATAAITGIALKGLQGTAELEQFGMALTNIAREVGNLVAPALRLVTGLLNQLTATFRGTGGAGQQLLMLMSPIGVIFEALGKSSVQGAITNLFKSFGQLVTVLQPLLNVLANVNDMLLETFVVAPLVYFTKALTFAVLLMAELAKNALQVVRAVAGFAGLSRLFDAPKRGRFEATLNQTGTEDAAGTFQRIQQAVFKASAGAEGADVQDKQLSELEQIKTAVNTALTVYYQIFNTLKVGVDAVTTASSQPAQVAQGGIAAGALGANVLLNKFFGGR
jgi:hypothetical protein